MTSPYPWIPNSSRLAQVSRKLVHLFAPSLRNRFPLPHLDGPLAVKEPHSSVLHGRPQKEDPFHYMEDLFDKKTVEYIRLEQAHFSLCDHKFDFKHGRGRVWAELDSKVVVSSREGGFDKGEERIGEWIYFTRTRYEGPGRWTVFYRKRLGEADIMAEELINPMKLQNEFGYEHCDVGVCRVSQDGQFLAYTLAVEGGDRYICHVKSIDSAALFHVIRSNIVSIDFGSRNQLFYTEANELNRPSRVIVQEIRPGILPPPKEIYSDGDERFFVDVRKTKDNEFIVVTSDSNVGGNAVVFPSSYPSIPFQLKSFFTDGSGREVCGRESWNWLEHYKGYFLRVTNDSGRNHRVVYCRVEKVLRDGMAAEWEELVGQREDVMINDIDIFEGKLVLTELHFEFERTTQMRIVDLSKGLEAAAKSRREDDVFLHFPPLTSVTPGLNKNFDQEEISFTYSSIAQPPKDCTFVLKNTLTAEQCKLTPPSGLYTQRQAEQFTPWDYMWPYKSSRDVCVSHDGEQIPITIVQQRDAFVTELTDFENVPDSPKHCLIYVYGSYGEIPSLHFQVAPFIWLLRRRWTIAFAHVRGGGEKLGWADLGKKEKKINTVLDFVACCDHMVSQGYTRPELMVACGNSAGCVPIAAAMNLRGNSLFGNALMRAPFLDIVNTMLDPDLPLSLSEREDWGDPAGNAADLENLQKYDPYFNINPRVTYPGIFISACIDDDRVPAWNTLKYVAKLRHQRALKGVDPTEVPLILRMRNTGGHHVWSSLQEQSEELVFLAAQLDLEGPGKQLNDMDMMTHLSNLADAGVVDTVESEKVKLKWDNWERERQDYAEKLIYMTHEPNYRRLKSEKMPFFWVPTAEELSQAVADAKMKEAQEQRAKKENSASQGSVGVPIGKDKYVQEKGAAHPSAGAP